MEFMSKQTNRASAIKIRLSDDEYAVITDCAKNQNLSLSDFLRRCVKNEICSMTGDNIPEYVEEAYNTSGKKYSELVYSKNLLLEYLLHDILDENEDTREEKAEAFIASIPEDGSSIKYPFSDSNISFKRLDKSRIFEEMVKEKASDRKSLDFLNSDEYKVWMQALK